MKRKSLKDSNPYLRDPEMRKKLIRRSVRTSSGVEGIKIDPNDKVKINIPSRGPKRIHKRKPTI